MNPYNYGKGAGVSPLFTAWFNDKSGLNQFCDLVYNKWWTRGAESVTDNNGAAEVSGFYGDYDVQSQRGRKRSKKHNGSISQGIRQYIDNYIGLRGGRLYAG